MTESEQVNIRIGEKAIEAIDKAVDLGVANSRSEFVRHAISEKLERLGLFKRPLSSEED